MKCLTSALWPLGLAYLENKVFGEVTNQSEKRNRMQQFISTLVSTFTGHILSCLNDLPRIDTLPEMFLDDFPRTHSNALNLFDLYHHCIDWHIEF